MTSRPRTLFFLKCSYPAVFIFQELQLATMVRVSHTAGGASSIVFGTEEPKTTPTKAPAPEPIAEAPAAEPAAPAAEEPAPATATPAAATETLDGLKLKLLNVANNLSKAGSEEAAAVAALIKVVLRSSCKLHASNSMHRNSVLCSMPMQPDLLLSSMCRHWRPQARLRGPRVGSATGFACLHASWCSCPTCAGEYRHHQAHTHKYAPQMLLATPSGFNADTSIALLKASCILSRS